LPFLDRFGAAADEGFSAVEFWWPGRQDRDALATAIQQAQVSVATFSLDCGETQRGERGLLADPDRVSRFRSSVISSLELAARLSCRRVYTLIGNRRLNLTRDEQLTTVYENLTWAADEARAYGIRILIESVNIVDNGPQVVGNTAEACHVVKVIQRNNVAVLFDVYHVHRVEGHQLVPTLNAFCGSIDHIQISDSPGRGEPGTGGVDFDSLFIALKASDYTGSLGLEYTPTTTTTAESLAWLDRVGLRSAEPET
jgi:hydroxypyruvate isomerase